MEMKTVHIGDLGDIKTGSTPSKKNPDNYGDYALWIKPTDINPEEKYTRVVEEMFSEKAANDCRSRLVPARSICVPCIGTVGTKLTMTPCDCFVNQSINAIIPNEEYDNDYVYYVLLNFLPNLKSINKGTASGREYIAKSAFENIELQVHADINVQRAIGRILSAYDDMIDNCKRQIALIEEAAQRFYREWFVDMRFPGHESASIGENGLPEGWVKVKLPEIASVRFGYAFDGSKFNSAGEGTPIIRIRNIPNSYTNDFTTENADEKYIIKFGDILVGMDGEFHINAWSDMDAYLVQRVCAIDPLNNEDRGFMFLAINAPIKFFERTLTGATVAHLGKKHLDSITILLPPSSLRTTFKSYFDLRLNKMRQLRYLVNSRDLLLPRLLSGQIEINA